MKVNLIVVKTLYPDELARQYTSLGLKFEFHKHEKGPWHYAASLHDLTFEIYPLPKEKLESDNTFRLGFEVENLDFLITQIIKTDWKIIAKAELSEWGYCAIIEDLDGRKIELKEKR